MGSLFGESKEQKQALGTLSGNAGFASNLGESDLSSSSGFWQNILKGGTDAEKALAPQISAIKEGAQQDKETAAQFGTRSGGTAAANQMRDDNTRKSIDNMITSLTSTAASELGGQGQGLLNLGTGAARSEGDLATTIQNDKTQALTNLGKSIGGFGQEWFQNFLDNRNQADA